MQRDRGWFAGGLSRPCPRVAPMGSARSAPVDPSLRSGEARCYTPVRPALCPGLRGEESKAVRSERIRIFLILGTFAYFAEIDVLNPAAYIGP